jgi:hypothetical protein
MDREHRGTTAFLDDEELPLGKKSTVPPKDQHKEKPLFLRLPTQYHQILERLARQGRRTLTSEAMIALEEYFTKHKMWPPKD